jgi:hypothetical protein
MAIPVSVLFLSHFYLFYELPLPSNTYAESNGVNN